MSRHVRRTLLALAAGTTLQRALVLLLNVWLMRRLGLAGFGDYAFGIQIAALLAMVADSGVRLLTARQIAADPTHGPHWLRISLRVRARRSLWMGLTFAGIVSLGGEQAPFLAACALLVPLAAFDMKQLADALGQAEREVRWETVATVVYVALTALVLLAGGGLTTLAGALVASRVAYAALALRWLARLGGGATETRAEPTGAADLRHAGALGLAQLGYEVVFSSQVVVLRALLGAEVAGLMAAAQRVVLAAETPVRLLARLLLPHHLHASRNGDPAATLERAVRAGAHLVLPLAAGGWVVAEGLLAWLSGPTFAAAAWALRWQLVATVVVGTLSHYSQAVVARGDLRTYFLAVAVGITLDVGLTLATVWHLGATGAALAAAVASTAATLTCLVALRRHVPIVVLRPWRRPVLHAAWVAGAALAALHLGVIAQLAAGGVAFALGLFWLELRGRTGQVGAGLQRSSGFMLDAEGEADAPTTAPPELVEAGR